jgi:UDP-GlcNAc:undecaprenyl-phosphate GlcNAc-1-phosphate transferase
MLSFAKDPYVVVFVSFVLGLVMTFAVRRFAWKYDFVARPKSDRWHNRPTAMLGGAAIFLATAGAFILFVPLTRTSLIIFGGSTLLFLVGLVDDILNIRPYQN